MKQTLIHPRALCIEQYHKKFQFLRNIYLNFLSRIRFLQAIIIIIFSIPGFAQEVTLPYSFGSVWNPKEVPVLADSYYNGLVSITVTDYECSFLPPYDIGRSLWRQETFTHPKVEMVAKYDFQTDLGIFNNFAISPVLPDFSPSIKAAQKLDYLPVNPNDVAISSKIAVSAYWGIEKYHEFLHGVLNYKWLHKNSVGELTYPVVLMPLKNSAYNPWASGSFYESNINSPFYKFVFFSTDGSSWGPEPQVRLDVIGHEFTHAFEHEARGWSPPSYNHELWSLDEAICDIIGVNLRQSNESVDPFWQWVYGDITKARSLKNPKLFLMPNTYQGQYWKAQPGLDVHQNSTVASFCYYITIFGKEGHIDDDSSKPFYEVMALDPDPVKSNALALKLFWETFMNPKLNPTYEFQEFAELSLETAETVLGWPKGSSKWKTVADAWFAVGVLDKYNPSSICMPAEANANGQGLFGNQFTFGTTEVTLIPDVPGSKLIHLDRCAGGDLPQIHTQEKDLDGNLMEFTDMNANNIYDLDDDPQVSKCAVSIHGASELTLKYFLEKHGFAGLDGLGVNSKPVVNIVGGTSTPIGDNFNPSDSKFYYAYSVSPTPPFPPISIDLVAHQVVKAMTYLKPGGSVDNLLEARVVRESLGDFFGTMVEKYKTGQHNWLIGEDVESGGIRDMSNPTLKGDPDHYLHYDVTLGPKENAGILDKAFYLMAEGGTLDDPNGNHYVIFPMGLDETVEVAFHIFESFDPSIHDLKDVRNLAVEFVQQNHGYASWQNYTTWDAFSAVGLGPPSSEIIEVIPQDGVRDVPAWGFDQFKVIKILPVNKLEVEITDENDPTFKVEAVTTKYIVDDPANPRMEVGAVLMPNYKHYRWTFKVPEDVPICPPNPNPSGSTCVDFIRTLNSKVPLLRFGTGLAQVELISPTDGEVVSSLCFDLEFQKFTDVVNTNDVQYTIQVSQNTSDFDNPANLVFNQTLTNAELSTVQYPKLKEGEYGWRVRAENVRYQGFDPGTMPDANTPPLNSDWSEVWSFNIKKPYSSAISPINDEKVAAFGVPIPLSCHHMCGVESYEYSLVWQNNGLFQSTTFEANISDGIVNGANFTLNINVPGSPLPQLPYMENGLRIQWYTRPKYKAEDNTIVTGTWQGEYGSFVLDAQSIPKVTGLQHTLNGGINPNEPGSCVVELSADSQPITFSWNSLPGALKYKVRFYYTHINPGTIYESEVPHLNNVAVQTIEIEPSGAAVPIDPISRKGRGPITRTSSNSDESDWDRGSIGWTVVAVGPFGIMSPASDEDRLYLKPFVAVDDAWACDGQYAGCVLPIEVGRLVRVNWNPNILAGKYSIAIYHKNEGGDWIYFGGMEKDYPADYYSFTAQDSQVGEMMAEIGYISRYGCETVLEQAFFSVVPVSSDDTENTPPPSDQEEGCTLHFTIEWTKADLLDFNILYFDEENLVWQYAIAEGTNDIWSAKEHGSINGEYGYSQSAISGFYAPSGTIAFQAEISVTEKWVTSWDPDPYIKMESLGGIQSSVELWAAKWDQAFYAGTATVDMGGLPCLQNVIGSEQDVSGRKSSRLISHRLMMQPANHIISSVSFYPNPVRDKLHIISESGPIVIWDMTGRVMYRGAFTQELDVSSLPAGLYTGTVGTNRFKFLKVN